MFYRAAEAAYWLLALANRVTLLRKSTFCFIFVASQKEVAPLGRKSLSKKSTSRLKDSFLLFLYSFHINHQNQASPNRKRAAHTERPFL